jgi:hypothetical protein
MAEFNEKLCETKHKALEDAIVACNKLQDSRFEAAKEALNLRSAELDKRLEGLNQLRAEVVKDREQFVRKETYDTAHEVIRSAQIETSRRLTIVETRSVVWTAAIAVFFVIVQIALLYWHPKGP